MGVVWQLFRSEQKTSWHVSPMPQSVTVSHSRRQSLASATSSPGFRGSGLPVKVQINPDPHSPVEPAV